MRTGCGVVVAMVMGLAMMSARPAWAANETVPAPLWKLARGLTNVVLGFPAEVLMRGLGAVTDGEESGTLGGGLSSLGAGAAEGVGYGVVRMASGIVDVVTFPVPFADNRPLLEPEFAF